MGKSEGEVKPYKRIVSEVKAATMTENEEGFKQWYIYQSTDFGRDTLAELNWYTKDDKPTEFVIELLERINTKPEGLVPAAALEELVKALEEIEPYLLPHFDGISDQYAHHKASDACRSALAHAREIAKGGK